MLALWAWYHRGAVGAAMNASQRRTLTCEGVPRRPPVSATASQPSRNSRSLTARHHGLPGRGPVSGLSVPRRTCQCMNESAARR